MDTDTADDSELNCIPELLMSSYNATSINLYSEKVSVLCAKIYQEYVASCSQVFFDNLGEITKLQNLSSAWKHCRGCTRASNFHEVYHQRSEIKQTGKYSKLNNRLLNYTSPKVVPELNYGK